jgi:hypothetical protein
VQIDPKTPPGHSILIDAGCYLMRQYAEEHAITQEHMEACITIIARARGRLLVAAEAYKHLQ